PLEEHWQQVAHTLEAASGHRRALSQLFERRDAAARELEERLASTRRDSATAQAEMRELEQLVGERRRRREELRGRLHGLELELASIDNQLRYFALESIGHRAPHFDLERHTTLLAELDAEISRCRAILADLQSREATVRRELAEIHPDGSSDGPASLADQRATLGVLEQLLDDLDVEVSQLARSVDPGYRSQIDSHARISPVAQMLRHQLYALCGQVSEQQRALRRYQLQAELRQLARAQTDLSEQLEHLLDRRHEQLHAHRVAHRSVMSLPAPPVHELCQCERHDDFVHSSDAQKLLYATPEQNEETLRRRRLAAQERVDATLRELHDAESALSGDQGRWEELQRRRRGAIDSNSVDRLRSELRDLEAAIDIELRRDASHVSHPPEGSLWKASDVLAQLTDGRLVQIRQGGEGRAATLVDSQGRSLALDALTPQQHDQLYLALTLAMISAHSARGVRLPLLLDEPFLRQDQASAAAMLGVLDAFARQGRQVLIFTEDRDARARCQSLGATVWDLDALRHEPAKAPAPVSYASPPIVPVDTATVRVVRETVDREGPQLRVAGDWSTSEEDPDFFYLETEAPLGAFPVLGPQTESAFAACDVRQIDDLLSADAEALAKRLNRNNVRPETVRMWQSHMSLMCFVPGVSLNDAQVLAACGVRTPDDWIDLDLETLAQRIQRWLNSPPGERFRHTASRYRSERLARWQRAAARHAGRWSQARNRYRWTQRRRKEGERAPLPRGERSSSSLRERNANDRRERRSTERDDAEGRRSTRQGSGRESAQRARTSSSSRDNDSNRRERVNDRKRRLRFLLHRSSPVADAPAIGEKTAERLAAVGIRTVADLLNADPESVVAELEVRHITAEVFCDWQRQARLVCCVPELHGYGAQILVACGLTEPQQVANADVGELYRKVKAFCRTKPGQRILRNGKAPSESKVADWVACAAHRRPLEAA
ncbi:MAG: DUF4332 domain-containing protein, partial [Planctomycetales bacterium]|nr:DUF4332 domain-containing protein [Planctomycetales bacterium]